MTQQRIHKIRANSFYQLLKESQDDVDVVTFSFDCQKNLALPKVPDQSAYFSLQLNFYHFAVIEDRSKGILNPSTIRSYVWTELDLQRGSNEIASAVYHTLKTFKLSDAVKTMRLFCDGCGAQNKNSIVIGMLCNWLTIWSDRKSYKKKSEITSPEQYIEIIQKWGKVYKLGDDVPVFDWKSRVQLVVKPPSQWHFKLQLSKRIIISKRNGSFAVRGESFYRNNLGISSSIVKRGRKMELKPNIVEHDIAIKPDKKISINKLLVKHYGEDWRIDNSLCFLKSALELDSGESTSTEMTETNRVTDNEEFCLAENLLFDI
nr:unnamed protein product [Callosobruchus chinensis]